MRDFRLDDPLQRFDLLFLLTTFFIVLEQGMPLRIGWISPYKITLIAMVIDLLFVAWRGDKRWVVAWRTKAPALFRSVNGVVLGLLLYIAFDLISLLYTVQKGFAMLKYVSIGSMAILLALLPLYFRHGVDSRKQWRRWLDSTVWPSVWMLGAVFLLLLVTGRTYYITNVSLIPDYNKFAFILTVGFLTLQYRLHRLPPARNGIRWPIYYIALALYLPVLLWIGSRRAPLLFYAIVFVSLILMTTPLASNRRKSAFRWQTAVLHLGLTLAIVFLAGRTVPLFDAHAKVLYNQIKEESIRTGKADPALQYEDDLNDVYGGIGHGAMDKRNAIWGIVGNELKTFTIRDWLIGKGATYHMDLFNQPEHRKEIERVYGHDLGLNGMDPHNFFLLELLNGGILKAGIVVFLCLCVLIRVLKFFPQEPETALFLLLFAFVHLVNLLLSSKHGLIENKYTWLLLIALTGCLQRKVRSAPRRQRKEHRMESA